MALATIGEPVVSNTIDRLMDMAFSFLGQKLLPAGDTEAELRRLRYKLPQIKAVLQAVENNQIKAHNEELEAWYWQFREAVERADDVLDEFEYKELEEKVQARNDQESSYLLVGKRKLFNYLRKTFKDDTLTRLVEAVRGLDRLVAGVDNFLNLEKHTSGFWGKNYEEYVKRGDDRETSSLLTETVVFGRDKERDLVVEWLTSNSVGEVHGTGNMGSLSAFTILGIGGLGKTTLAQLICKDDRVKQYFDQVIWVYVSRKFDVVEIIIKILEVITNERPAVRSLESLQKILKEKLSTKKFVVVLDDVWNDDEDISEWEKLVAPLRFGHAKSKILVTSRMESVADKVSKVIDGTKDYLKLEGLEENKFFALFNKHAFAGVDPAEFEHLHLIGKQIAKKLGGCPLAAKVMGGVLNNRMKFDYWNKVLKEDVPNFLSGRHDMMAVLRFSYNHLPTHLQVCFRYCSIFSKGYRFQKDEVIKIWMGSGLIERKHKKCRPEDIGSEYFNLLVRKSFFDISFPYYVMHDLLHDLARFVSQGECLGIEKGLRNVPKTIRHLWFQLNHVHDLQEITHLENLRTLHISFGDDYSNMQKFNETLKQFKSLHLLCLTGRKLQATPDAIGELIHLRYLSLKLLPYRPMSLPVRFFPPSICQLYHLEVIRIPYFDTNSLFDIFYGINKSCLRNLIKLRYLDIDNIHEIHIPEIGKLSCLQELYHFHVRDESGYHINELGSLRSLCKLRIVDIMNVKNLLEAKEARLSEKEYLKDLELDWSVSHPSFSNEFYENLLDNLEPHINLEVLNIKRYGGSRPPIWMTRLVNLKTLELYYCIRLSSLPALGKLPLLERLTILSLPDIKKLDHTFYGNGEGYSFPVLKELKFWQMRDWEEWVEENGMSAFPRLETLTLHCCPKLRKLPSLPPILESLTLDCCPELRRLPSLPPSLRRLLVCDVGIHFLPKICESIGHDLSTKPSFLSKVNIEKCNNLISLEDCFLQQPEHIQSLTDIYIIDCFNHVNLPSSLFIDLNSLRLLSVKIYMCPKLLISSLPSSLQELCIENCGLEMGSLGNLTKLKTLDLSDCPNLTSLQQLSQLTALASLSIDDCKGLVSLDGLDSLTSLRDLDIQRFDTNVSQEFNARNSSLRLDRLCISHPSLLNLEPLRSLEWTKRLVLETSGSLLPEEWLLRNCSSLQSLIINDATNLERLPASIERMQLLETLLIRRACLIRSLPNFPSSLVEMYLDRCHPSLKEKYKRDSGVEWYRIARFRWVDIR